MRVVKSIYEVTPDMRDGFGQQRRWLRDEKWESVEDYATEVLQSESNNQGVVETIDIQLDHLQSTVARLIGKLTEVLRLSPGDLAEIVGDHFATMPAEELKLEE